MTKDKRLKLILKKNKQRRIERENREDERRKKRKKRDEDSLVFYVGKNKFNGGLGDRIKSIIECKLLSKLLEKKFYILWKKEDIKEYMNYEKYDFEKTDAKMKKVYILRTYSFSVNLKSYLKGKNIDISKISFKNLHGIVKEIYKKYGNKNYYNKKLEEYNMLYRDIFKPTPKLNEKINKLVNNRDNIVGIQVRTGDIYLCDKNESNEITGRLGIILKNIKKKCDESFNNYSIFVTSDYNEIYNICLGIWCKKNIIYNDDILTHLDKETSRNNSKTFADNYILSQKTVCLFISPFLEDLYKRGKYRLSGYGKIAGLSCRHDNIYDIFLKKFEKIKLLKNK